MANVFISHAGADSGWAKQVHGWLKEDGHEVFLDRDRNDGVLPGEEWKGSCTPSFARPTQSSASSLRRT